MIVTAELLCSAIIALNIGGSAERAEYACAYTPQIVEISDEMKIRPELLVALIHHESTWNPYAVGAPLSCGLTQVSPKYTGDALYPKGSGVPSLSCDQLLDPQISIDAGARSLRYWIHQYGNGQEKIGLCGYNAGFRCHIEQPNENGMKYADRVISTANRIRGYMHSN